MGFDRHGVEFLFFAKAEGVDFSSTAMLGRQQLEVSRRQLRKCFRDFQHGAGIILDNGIVEGQNENYAERLLSHLGADVIHSFDVSAYEGATHIHDMNTPLPEKYKHTYTLVIDGGTLEHVFNIPIALRNCMEMLKNGGHYLSITPTNNFMGHGFYQFSPELYFRVFSPENGFTMQYIMLCELKAYAKWYRVTDPLLLRRRGTFTNTTPTYLFVLAQRVKECPILKDIPQQSDYERLWQQENADHDSLVVTKLKHALPSSLKHMLKRWFFPLFTAKGFRQFDIQKHLRRSSTP